MYYILRKLADYFVEHTKVEPDIELLLLEKAISNENYSQFISALSGTNINKILPISGIKPLNAAIAKDNTLMVKLLVTQGARISEISEDKSAVSLNLVSLEVSSRLLVGKLQNKLIHSKYLSILEDKNDPLIFKRKVLQALLDASRKILQSSIDVSECIDLYLFASNIISSIEESKSILINKIKTIFTEREDAILGTRIDYSFALSSPVNDACIKIAKLISPDQPFNTLLHKATMEDNRTIPWFDSIEGTDAISLPHPKYFFRTKNNEIHDYRYILEQAIAGLKDDRDLMATIWFGTDPKFITPVPPLGSSDLDILKRRSPELKKLVEYTEALDNDIKFRKNLNVYKKLSILRDQLYAGDHRRVGGSHTEAGGAAYAAIADFADWWRRLSTENPKICAKIRSIHDSEAQSLGDIFDILLYQGDTDNNQRQTNTLYCVNLKAGALDRILAKDNVKRELKKINLFLAKDEKSEKFLKPKLDDIKTTILQELKQQDKTTILTKDMTPFIPFNNFELNILAINKNVITSYKDLLTASNGNIVINKVLLQNNIAKTTDDLIFDRNKPTTTKKILQLIMSETNNANLFKLRSLLLKSKYDYLRSYHGEPRTLFGTSYYAHIEEKRTQTSCQYSTIESAIAAKLVDNATRSSASKLEAKHNVDQIYLENDFMKCKHKHKLSFQENKKYQNFFDGIKTLDASKRLLEKKMASYQKHL